MAFRECERLDALWIEYNPKGKYWLRRRAHRLFLRELLAFYVCVTDRWFIRHSIDHREDLMNAILDDVCEERLKDSWRAPVSIERRAEADYSLAQAHAAYIDTMRVKYSHQDNEKSDNPDYFMSVFMVSLVTHFGSTSKRPCDIEAVAYFIIERLSTTRAELNRDCAVQR